MPTSLKLAIVLVTSLTLFSACDPAKTDSDADGILASVDCDDTDPALGDVAFDSREINVRCRIHARIVGLAN